MGQRITLIVTVLNILRVHQDHLRQGAGKLLILSHTVGTGASRRLTSNTLLEGQSGRLSIVLKAGFHQVDTVIVKAADWDAEFDRHYNVTLKLPVDLCILAIERDARREL